MRFDILTLFPNMFIAPFQESILGKAIEKGLIQIQLVNIRDFAADKHQVVDDAPYGGGQGMVMKVEPIARAIESVKAQNPSAWTIYLTPQGKPFDQDMARALSSRSHLILLCGRYEGVDERVRELFADEEISIGDYDLTGGEFAAMVRFPPQTSPDKFFVNAPSLMYSYGAPGAKGRFELFTSNAVKRYLNNQDVTAGSNRDTWDYGGAFYWRAMPKTSFLAEARGTELDFQQPTSTLSGRETRVYAGVTWDATAATYGTIKVGQLRKSYDSPRPTYSEPSWEGMVTWMPRTYSKIDVYSSRQPLESTGQGDFILSDATGAVWTHGWTSVFSTDVNARFVKDRYQGFNARTKPRATASGQITRCAAGSPWARSTSTSATPRKTSTTTTRTSG